MNKETMQGNHVNRFVLGQDVRMNLKLTRSAGFTLIELMITVAVVGILSALLALQLERAREFAVLRAIGMTVGEIGGLAALQTGLMGAMAGLAAIPTGLLLAAVLIFVINRRAFGWGLPFEVSPWLLLETVGLAILAALVAGLYPIWRQTRSQPAAALRTD